MSAFCGTHRSHVIEARIDILRKRFLYVVSKYERSTKSGAYREKRLNVFFRAEIWKFRNSRISMDISAIGRCMRTTLDRSDRTRLAIDGLRRIFRENVRTFYYETKGAERILINRMLSISADWKMWADEL